MTELEILVGLFNMVGALAESLTSQVPIGRIETAPGKFVNFRPITGPCRVKWQNPDGSLSATDGQRVPENGEPVKLNLLSDLEAIPASSITALRFTSKEDARDFVHSITPGCAMQTMTDEQLAKAGLQRIVKPDATVEG